MKSNNIEEAILITPMDEVMEQALVRKNITDAVIASLKEKFGELRLRSVDDKENYIEIKEAAKVCAKVRNAAVKCCKEGREDAVAIQKKWVAKEKEVVGKISEVETPLDAEITKFDAEVKRKEDEEKQRQETQYMLRTQALTKMGGLYSDASFTIGDFTLEANLVKESSQEVWDDEILPKFTEQHLIIEGERVNQERIKAEHEAEMKRQQAELLQKQREFETQQAEFKRQQEETARIQREKIQEEEQEKLRQRSQLQNKRFQELYEYNKSGSDVDMNTLWSLTDEKFGDILLEKKKSYEEYQLELSKKLEEAAAQKERERIAEASRLAELKVKQDEENRLAELEKAGDKAKWDDFIEQLSKIQVPKARSWQYRNLVNAAKTKLEEILSSKP